MVFLLAALALPATHAYDLVINHGRVMDPESGLDAVRHLGIEQGRIAVLSATPLRGDKVINANGLVVAPGFIDLHAHGQDARSNGFQAQDGVTTVIEGEIGVLPLGDWLDARRGKSRQHFGASASHLAARAQLLTGEKVGNPIYADNLASRSGTDFANAVLDGAQRNRLMDLLQAGLLEGGLGIGIGSTYTPGADHTELFRVFQLAAAHEVPVFIHLRQARYMGGDPLAPLQEALANAAAAGASLHVVHINSSLDTHARVAVEMIRGMRARNIDITTESYPYTAGSTRLESALFDDYQGDYAQLQWTLTGERLTEETFHAYREQGGWVILHGRDEPTNLWLVAQPDIMVASDGVPFLGDASHPRGAGTFARVLGHYVRDLKALDLMTGIRKMTLDPARRLERQAPAMRRKGRIKPGADADLTLFSASEILDQATYTLPARASAGIAHVLVGGVFVVRDGALQADVYPGVAIRSELKRDGT